MLFLIIENFLPGKTKALYQKFDRDGRLLPKGVVYLDSWISEDLGTCYQLMESESKSLIEDWTLEWNMFAEFEIVPVISSAIAKEKILKG